MSSSESVARVYRSELRTQQATATRQRIVAASAALFSESGYYATTLAAIAREAGVSVETVKAGTSKAELLIAAFEVTFSGAEARGSLAETPAGEGVLDLPDDAFLDAVVARIAAANARGHALWTVLLGAALSDEVVARALRGMLERRAADYAALVSELERRGIASAAFDRAAAAAEVSFVMSPEGYQQLVVQSGWDVERYRAFLHRRVRECVAAA
jgi:AcrR family transcriptional regulator